MFMSCFVYKFSESAKDDALSFLALFHPKCAPSTRLPDFIINMVKTNVYQAVPQEDNQHMRGMYSAHADKCR